MSCRHDFKPCGPQQSMCSKCGLLRNTGTRRITRALHLHTWHRDRKSHKTVCRTCGETR